MAQPTQPACSVSSLALRKQADAGISHLKARGPAKAETTALKTRSQGAARQPLGAAAGTQTLPVVSLAAPPAPAAAAPPPAPQEALKCLRFLVRKTLRMMPPLKRRHAADIYELLWNDVVGAVPEARRVFANGSHLCLLQGEANFIASCRAGWPAGLMLPVTLARAAAAASAAPAPPMGGDEADFIFKALVCRASARVEHLVAYGGNADSRVVHPKFLRCALGDPQVELHTDEMLDNLDRLLMIDDAPDDDDDSAYKSDDSESETSSSVSYDEADDEPDEEADEEADEGSDEEHDYLVDV